MLEVIFTNYKSVELETKTLILDLRNKTQVHRHREQIGGCQIRSGGGQNG